MPDDVEEKDISEGGAVDLSDAFLDDDVADVEEDDTLGEPIDADDEEADFLKSFDENY
jgi:hypothetical protein